MVRNRVLNKRREGFSKNIIVFFAILLLVIILFLFGFNYFKKGVSRNLNVLSEGDKVIVDECIKQENNDICYDRAYFKNAISQSKKEYCNLIKSEELMRKCNNAFK